MRLLRVPAIVSIPRRGAMCSPRESEVDSTEFPTKIPKRDQNINCFSAQFSCKLLRNIVP